MTKFEVFQDASGDWRFRMRASNGEIVLSSESYTAKHSALAGINSIKANAHRAEVVMIEEEPKAERKKEPKAEVEEKPTEES